MSSTTSIEARPIGSLIASNPPGPRPSYFRVLGNNLRGFQVWLSRDGLNWIPAGESHTSYPEMAAAFAEHYPRPAEILDAVLAAAFDAQTVDPPL
jgi:hypothetical protein